jgi:hypothetical protein
LFGLILSHYFDRPDIQKHKFFNFVSDGDALQLHAMAVVKKSGPNDPVLLLNG